MPLHQIFLTLTTAKNKINLTQFNTAMYKLNCTYLISLLIASNCSCSIRARVWASVGPLGDHMSKASITDSFSLPSSLPLASNACCSFSSIWACFNFSCSCSFRVLTWNTGFSFYFICKISAANFHKTNNLTSCYLLCNNVQQNFASGFFLLVNIHLHEQNDTELKWEP